MHRNLTHFSFLLTLLFIGQLVFAQNFNSLQSNDGTFDYYIVQANEGDVLKELQFRKAPTAKDFTFYGFSHEPFDKKIILHHQIQLLKQMYQFALNEITVTDTMSEIYFGRPLSYSDVFKKQTIAFANSKEWDAHVQENIETYGRYQTCDYQLVGKLMLEDNVYADVDVFLKPLGYHVVGFNLKKVFFFEKEHLATDGLVTSAPATKVKYCPFPFFIHLVVEKVDEP